MFSSKLPYFSECMMNIGLSIVPQERHTSEENGTTKMLSAVHETIISLHGRNAAKSWLEQPVQHTGEPRWSWVQSITE
jgi:hypothetical protein